VPALDLALAHWITGRAASVFDLAVGIYPYMLRGLAIDRPNQVWAIDITYVPMARLHLPRCRHGLVQLPGSVVARVEHDGRGILSQSLEEALTRHGNRQIFNTDPRQPVHVSILHRRPSRAFTDVLVEHQIAISMDGRGSWRDKVVFLERFWRSVKYEELCLRPMTASTRRELRLTATSTSTAAIGLIRTLTGARPIKPISTRRLSARRPNPVTPAEAPLIDPEILSRQPRPPHTNFLSRQGFEAYRKGPGVTN